MARRNATPDERQREIAEKADNLAKLLNKMALIDDCLERAQGALEGQIFQSGRNATYVVGQLDRAMQYLADAKAIAQEACTEAQDGLQTPGMPLS